MSFHRSLTAALLLSTLLAAAGHAQTNLAPGGTYSWDRVPGQPVPHYRDDWSINGLHDVHTIGVGVFDKGDLNDGHNWTVGDPIGGGPSPLVVQYPGAPVATVKFDLGGVFNVENIIVGTYVNAGINNNAPSSVSVSYSLDDILYSASVPYDLETAFGPLTDGHHDMSLDLAGGVPDTLAQFVSLTFGPGSMTEPGGGDPNEKWSLDEIQIIGSVVPEPTSIATWSLLGLGLAGFGYCRVRRKK